MGRGQAATASRGDLRTGWHRQLAALGSSRGSLSPGPAPPAGSWILLARVDLRVLCPQPCTQLWASESRAIPSKGETYWGLPFPSKTKAPGQRGRKGTQLRMWPSPRLPAGRPDVSWPLLPLYRGLLGVRNTGVGACRCPTLKDPPPRQIRPSAQQRSHHTGRPGFPDGGGCSLHGSPGHRAARGRLFTRTLRPRPGLCRREGDLSSAMWAQPRRAGWQPPSGRARPPRAA